MKLPRFVTINPTPPHREIIVPLQFQYASIP
jgi:hypothetical protein